MMHLKTLLLLAVHSNVITAAVLRRGHFARSGVYVRSFNQSAIDDAAVQPLNSVDPSSLSILQAPLAPTTKQIGSVPAAGSGPGAAQIDEEDIVSANTAPPKPLITDPPSLFSPQAPLPITTKQIGSVPAVGSGPGAAKIDEEDIVSANTEPPNPLITDPPSLSSPQAPLPITTKQIGSVPAVGSGPGAAKIDEEDIVSANTEPPEPLTTVSSVSFGKENDDSSANTSKQIGKVPAVGSGPDAATLPAAEVASANTRPPELFSTTTTVSLTSSLPVFLRRSKVSSDILASRFSSSQPAAPIVTNVPVAGSSNAAMAKAFNQFFDSMNADSECKPGIETQRMVCIDKKTAVCGADGKYKLSACSQNEICRAVPLDQSQTGIAIKCVPEAESSRPSPSKSAGKSKTVVAASSPSSALETRPPKVVITTQTIVVTPLPKTSVPAKPTKSVVSGMLSFLASLEKGMPTGKAATQTNVVTSLPSAVSKPTPRKSVVSGMLSFLASLEQSLPSSANFVTVATPSPSAVPVSPAPPNDPPPPSPTTSEQPAIVIEPVSRKDAEPTACPDSVLDPLLGGGAKGCVVVHG